MGSCWISSSDYYNENKKTRKGKQSKLPKKPKQEPPTKIIPGNHKVIFKKASELKK